MIHNAKSRYVIQGKREWATSADAKQWNISSGEVTHLGEGPAVVIITFTSTYFSMDGKIMFTTNVLLCIPKWRVFEYAW